MHGTLQKGTSTSQPCAAWRSTPRAGSAVWLACNFLGLVGWTPVAAMRPAGDQDTSYTELIKDLVTTYIKKERTIIVAAISCKDDLHNQVLPCA